MGYMGQYVTYNGISSQSTWVKCGVPQGSILGPMLFLIYINDLPNVTSLFSVLYADDTKMFDSGKELDILMDNINSELNNICDWLNADKLSLNVSKTHFMIWAPRATMMSSLKPIVISGHEIDKVCNTKFLGIVLDDRLNWKSHIQYIKNKTSKAIGILKKMRPFINISTMVSLYYSFIYPYLMYCVHVWGQTYASNLDCLNKLQKRIVILIAGVPPREHTAPLFMKYGILQMSQIADYNIGIFMYKIYYKEVPAIFDSYFTLNCDIHDYNTLQRCCIHVDQVKTNRRDMTMRIQGGKVWNSILLNDIDINNSIYAFKKSLKSHLLKSLQWILKDTNKLKPESIYLTKLVFFFVKYCKIKLPESSYTWSYKYAPLHLHLWIHLLYLLTGS